MNSKRCITDDRNRRQLFFRRGVWQTKSDDRVGHLNIILARGGGNLNDRIFNSSNARGLPEGEDVEVSIWSTHYWAINWNSVVKVVLLSQMTFKPPLCCWQIILGAVEIRVGRYMQTKIILGRNRAGRWIKLTASKLTINVQTPYASFVPETSCKVHSIVVLDGDKLPLLDWKLSSGWLESWGLLLATDVSTTCAEVIFRVKWSFLK